MISAEASFLEFRGNLRASGECVTLSWDEEKWFFDYSNLVRASEIVVPCIRLEISKKVMVGFKEETDIDPKWKSDGARFIVCNPEQELLLTTCEWKAAKDLVLDKDQLQNLCGNGHYSVPIHRESFGAVRCYDFESNPHGTYIASGVVFKAANYGRSVNGGGGSLRGDGAGTNHHPS